ncbi:MAG: FAD-binding protein [Saprospiraceae bacterium]|nr:FAD-binding protein [Saprospiraceae bacterium]
MKNAYLSQNFVDKLIQIVGLKNCSQTYSDLQQYGHDETEDLIFLPDIVVKPNSTEQVSQILQHCNQHKIPITVRGAGTGLAGGALPVRGGVLLTMERFDNIIDIDERNLQVTVEPGVITEVLQNVVKEKGLFYPPDPASKGWCFIGGNISTNSGGPKAVKYGVVKDYVLNLEVVLPSGEIIWTGANTLKNSTGYNLTQLIVGSEGTLAVVTKIVLKLLPHPHFNLLLLAPFSNALEACAAVSAIFRAGITPSALEFMEREAIEWAIRYTGDATISLTENTQAHLLIELDGNYLDTLQQDCEKILTILETFNVGDVLFADSEAQKSDLWRLRRNVAQAVKTNSVYKEEDTVVPRAALPELLAGVKNIGQQYGFQSVCYGHAGDGNLHINIIKGNLSDETWHNELPKAIREIFILVKSLGGTLSGEHGIGFVQRPYMDIMFGEASFALFAGIKKVFDPNNILNPDKIF